MSRTRTKKNGGVQAGPARKFVLMDSHLDLLRRVPVGGYLETFEVKTLWWLSTFGYVDIYETHGGFDISLTPKGKSVVTKGLRNGRI